MRWSLFKRSGKDSCERIKEMLSVYVDRRLGSGEQKEVEQHLASCHGCQEELDSLRAMVGLLNRMPQVSPSRSFAIAEVKPVPRPRAIPVLRAATAMVAVALVFLFASDSANLFEATPTVVDEKGNTSRSLTEEDMGGTLHSLNGSNDTDKQYESSTPSEGNGAGEQGDTAPTSGEEKGAEAGWLSLLEYSLLGLVVVLGGLIITRWRRGRHRLNRV